MEGTDDTKGWRVGGDAQRDIGGTQRRRREIKREQESQKDAQSGHKGPSPQNDNNGAPRGVSN